MGEIPKEIAYIKAETREKIRRAMVRVLEEPARESKGAISAEKVRAAASANNNTCAALLRAWRAGQLSLAESWGGPSAEPEGDEGLADLARKMREAKSDADRTAVLLEASAHALELNIPAGLLQALTGALNAARQSDKEARAVEPEEVERVLPATEEAVPLVEAFEGITSDVRRKLALEFVLEQLAKDQAEGPKAIAPAEGEE